MCAAIFAFFPSLCTAAPLMQQTASRRTITTIAVSVPDAVWPITVAYESYLYLNKIFLRHPESSASLFEYCGLQFASSDNGRLHVAISALDYCDNILFHTFTVLIGRFYRKCDITNSLEVILSSVLVWCGNLNAFQPSRRGRTLIIIIIFNRSRKKKKE